MFEHYMMSIISVIDLSSVIKRVGSQFTALKCTTVLFLLAWQIRASLRKPPKNSFKNSNLRASKIGSSLFQQTHVNQSCSKNAHRIPLNCSRRTNCYYIEEHSITDLKPTVESMNFGLSNINLLPELRAPFDSQKHGKSIFNILSLPKFLGFKKMVLQVSDWYDNKNRENTGITGDKHTNKSAVMIGDSISYQNLC